MKKIINIGIAIMPVLLSTVAILTINFDKNLPAYLKAPVYFLVVALLLFMPVALIWFAVKMIKAARSRTSQASKEARPGSKPSNGRRHKPNLREIMQLRKSIEFARQPDGSAIVYPSVLMWRGYRLTPEQATSYQVWSGGTTGGGRRKHRAAWLLVQLTGSVACICLLWFVIFRPDLQHFVYVAVTVVLLAGSTYLLHTQRKRAFENQFPDATERARDPKRFEKHVLILMLMPMWGHIGTGLFAPALLWGIGAAVIRITSGLLEGTLALGPGTKDVVTTAMVGALAAGVTYAACRHILPHPPRTQPQHGRFPRTLAAPTARFRPSAISEPQPPELRKFLPIPA